MSLDVTLKDGNDNVVFEGNITHNLSKMASEAGIYMVLWRPEELGATEAKHIAGIVSGGLLELISQPSHYKQFDAPNGWGSWINLVEFAANYAEALHKHPEAKIKVWR